VCYCAIDTCLNFSQANKLIKDLKPGHLVVAETYTQPPVTLPHKTEYVINWVCFFFSYVISLTQYSSPTKGHPSCPIRLQSQK
jgi:hypothetical protein